MIVVTATIVAHGGADVFRNTVDAAKQLLEPLFIQRGMFVQRRVQVADIGLMVLAVVDLHRLRVDLRFERGVVVGQRRLAYVRFPLDSV